jgi:hypothetical protein
MNVLKNSVFTLCIRGHSQETMRLYDAIHAGSIPVIDKQTKFLKLKEFADHPFVVVDGYSQVGKILKEFTKNRAALRAKQEEVILFYPKLLARVVAGLKDLIDAQYEK